MTEGKIGDTAETQQKSAKRAVSIVGRVLSLIALGYFIYVLAGQWSELRLDERWGQAVTLCLLFSLAYALFQLILAEQWHHLVRSFASSPVPRSATYFGLLHTQIAKYLPGNVFHLLGRHLLLDRFGIPHRSLFAALVWETAFLVAGAVLVASLVLAVAPTAQLLALAEEHGLTLWLPIAVVVLLCVAGTAARAFAGDALPFGKHVPKPRLMAMCLAFTTIFVVGQGLMFAGMGWALTGSFELALIGISAAAWVAGFVTPGAPGGVGVREAVMLLLLGADSTNPDFVLAIALFRIAGALGDLLWFFLATLLWPEQASYGRA